MYRTVSNDFTEGDPFDYDLLIFFSPSGIQALLKNFPDFKQGDISIGTFGPATAKAVRDAGLRLDLEAPSPEYPSITAAIADGTQQQHVQHHWVFDALAFRSECTSASAGLLGLPMQRVELRTMP